MLVGLVLPVPLSQATSEPSGDQAPEEVCPVSEVVLENTHTQTGLQPCLGLRHKVTTLWEFRVSAILK